MTYFEGMKQDCGMGLFVLLQELKASLEFCKHSSGGCWMQDIEQEIYFFPLAKNVCTISSLAVVSLICVFLLQGRQDMVS